MSAHITQRAGREGLDRGSKNTPCPMFPPSRTANGQDGKGVMTPYSARAREGGIYIDSATTELKNPLPALPALSNSFFCRTKIGKWVKDRSSRPARAVPRVASPTALLLAFLFACGGPVQDPDTAPPAMRPWIG